jgi:hypothetical protein
MHLRLGSVTAALALLAGCDGTPLPSDGSRFETMRSWQSDVTGDGHPRAEWIAPDGDLPADTLSVTLVAHTDAQAWLGFEVLDMSARRLIDADMPESSPNRALPSRGVAVAMLPSAVGSLPLSRNFQVTAHLLQSSVGIGLPSVDVLVKRTAGGALVPRIQDLPLALVVVGERLPDAGNLQRTLDGVTDIWARAGVQIRPLPVVQRTDAEIMKYQRIELDPTLGSNTPALGELLALSKTVTAPGVDRPLVLFLVNDIVAGPGMGVWAVAGGIPVAPMLGTRRSGVAVNAQVVDLDPSRAAQVLAHEIGHALGLYHTSEGTVRAGLPGEAPLVIHDQLTDTAECPGSADVNPQDGVLTPDECEPWDSRNLMFWAGTRVSTGISVQQADIARRSALTR